MPFDQLIQAASLGGFVFASVVLLSLLVLLFNTVQQGKLVSRSMHDKVVSDLSDTNGQLRTDLRTSVQLIGKLSDAIDHLATQLSEHASRLTDHDAAMRERMASVQASVEANQRQLSSMLQGRGRGS